MVPRAAWRARRPRPRGYRRRWQATIPPLEALVQHVELTDDRESAALPLARETGLSVDDLLAMPYVLTGTIAQIVEQLVKARDRWGITRWVVRRDALEVAEQVIAALPA